MINICVIFKYLSDIFYYIRICFKLKKNCHGYRLLSTCVFIQCKYINCGVSHLFIFIIEKCLSWRCFCVNFKSYLRFFLWIMTNELESHQNKLRFSSYKFMFFVKRAQHISNPPILFKSFIHLYFQLLNYKIHEFIHLLNFMKIFSNIFLTIFV